MRIGVITIVLNENYGGILQAFALQTVLKEMGHEVTLIDRWRGWHFTLFEKYKSYSKRFIKKHLLGANIPVRYDVAVQNEIKAISTHTRPFIEKYIKRIITRDFKNIKPNDFDAFMATKQAIEKAHSFGFDLNGAVIASDAFFPFADCVELAHQAGVNAVIQPGGSIRDNDTIEYCNNNDMAMVMTHIRHFKH